MASLYDLANGRTANRALGAADDGRYIGWDRTAARDAGAATNGRGVGGQPAGMGSFSWNQPLSDADKMWFYNYQHDRPDAWQMFGDTDQWRQWTNDVGNSDLLAQATQQARSGAYGSYSSPFADALKAYGNANPLAGGVGQVTGAAPTAAPTSPAPAAATNDTIPNFGDPITDPSAYLNPYMDWAIKQAMDKIQQSAAARGNLNSGSTVKALADYLAGATGQNWNNAEQFALADAARRYGVYNNDRNFDYMANVGDRNYNSDNLRFLATLGLNGMNNSSQLQSTLAQLLSGNTVASGLAQGAGTQGQSAVWNILISQLMRNWGYGG